MKLLSLSNIHSVSWWYSWQLGAFGDVAMTMSWYETLSALLALCEGNPPVTGGFPSQRTSNADFDVTVNKRLNKQLSCRWFEKPWRSWWHHCNASGFVHLIVIINVILETPGKQLNPATLGFLPNGIREWPYLLASYRLSQHIGLGIKPEWPGFPVSVPHYALAHWVLLAVLNFDILINYTFFKVWVRFFCNDINILPINWKIWYLPNALYSVFDTPTTHLHLHQHAHTGDADLRQLIIM